MTPTITAFERSPDRGKGLARDMRVRWALEEVGQPYDVRLPTSVLSTLNWRFSLARSRVRWSYWMKTSAGSRKRLASAET